MIDAIAAEFGSIKFHIKINVQTSELMCHAVCLFKQASLPLVFYLVCVFSGISTTLRKYSCDSMKGCVK